MPNDAAFAIAGLALVGKKLISTHLAVFCYFVLIISRRHARSNTENRSATCAPPLCAAASSLQPPSPQAAHFRQ